MENKEPIIPIIKPEPKQFEAYQLLFDKFTQFVLFGGGSGGGKTWLGAEWLMQNCYRYPGSHWFIGRNELTRLMGSSYQTWLKVCEFHKIPQADWRLNGQYHFIEFRNTDSKEFDDKGSRIDLIDLAYKPTDPMYQRFGSLEYTGGWIEEGGEVNFAAFDMLKSRVGRWMNDDYNLFPPKILITCNPEQNWLYRIFYKPFQKGSLPGGYSFVQSLYGDNSYTRDQYEKQLSSITDPVLRMRLKMGLWEYAEGDNTLISYDAITDLFTNSVTEASNKFMTADIARLGSDLIVYGLWRGLNLYRVVVKQKQGIDQTIGDIAELARLEGVPYSQIVADEDGVGGGVIDGLRGIKGFVGNSQPLKRKDGRNNPKENYRNLRSQCAYITAEKINNHEVAITDKDLEEKYKEMIVEDLQQIKRKDPEKEGPLAIVPKEEIKDALGRSPDMGDMILMRMFFELDRPKVFPLSYDVGGVKPYLPGIDSPIDLSGGEMGSR